LRLGLRSAVDEMSAHFHEMSDRPSVCERVRKALSVVAYSHIPMRSERRVPLFVYA
jgi:hypothetical protein